MIKRIIACLTICLIITGLLSPVFSDASAFPQPNWSDPGISEIINISDLTGWMLNGGTYDVSTYTDAESFMNDYFSARTKTRLEGPDYQIKSTFGLEQTYYTVGDSAYAHPLDVNRAISSAFRDHTGYGRRFSSKVNDALLSTGHLYDTKIPLLNEIEFANFVGYNHDALNLYAQSFENEDDNPVNPDPNFSTAIDFINGSGFFFKDWTTRTCYNTGGYPTQNFPYSNYSYVNTNANGLSQNLYSGHFEGGQSPIFDIYIHSVTGGQYYYNCSATMLVTTKYYGDNVTGLSFRLNNQGVIEWIGVAGSSTGTYNYSSPNFNNLSLLFDNLKAKFKNVNIYVDGVAWSLVNNTLTPHITPEFPDAVGGEDLPSTTWPVHRPLAPYFITSPGMLQAIQDAIDSDGKLDIDDLKPYLTDENGDPVPDPQFDPEPVPLPVPDPINPDVVPGLPILPAMPPDMPGFSGVSVLAEIINFTNQSLPTSLIVTFWGIVFGIVILGLIKILHK